MKKDNYKSILNSIGLFDKIKYNKLSIKNSNKYKEAKPFPNIQFENFLSKEIANNLNKSFPKYNSSKWFSYKNFNTTKNSN